MRHGIKMYENYYKCSCGQKWVEYWDHKGEEDFCLKCDKLCKPVKSVRSKEARGRGKTN